MEAYEASRKFADMVVACAIALKYGKADKIGSMRDSDVEVECFRRGNVTYVQLWNSAFSIIELSDFNEGELNCKIFLGNNVLDVRNVKVETDDSYLMIYIEGKNGEHIFEFMYRIVN